MRKSSVLFSLIVMLTLVFTSCSDDLPTVANATKSLESRSWIITQYMDEGSDESYYFADYSFTFNNGVVTATKSGAATVTGTYIKGFDDGKEKFILDFGSVDPFDELNEDWEVLESSKSIIRFVDSSGGNGGTDYLTFERE